MICKDLMIELTALDSKEEARDAIQRCGTFPRLICVLVRGMRLVEFFDHSRESLIQIGQAANGLCLSPGSAQPRLQATLHGDDVTIDQWQGFPWGTEPQGLKLSE